MTAASSLLTRRALLGTAALSLLAAPALAESTAKLRLDGLYEAPWITPSTLDLTKDLAAAARAGKGFVVLWEMRGCPWCKLLHTVNFARPDIAAYAMENFTFVQFDIRGRREITDTDGQKLPEESLSLKYNVNSTPTIQFFKPSDASRAFELGRVGYLKPDMFLAMLHFVRERGYENGPFDEWAKTHGVPI